MKNTKTLSRFIKLFLALFVLSCQFAMAQEVAALLPYQNKSYLDFSEIGPTPNEVLLSIYGPEHSESCTLGSNFMSMRDDLTSNTQLATYFASLADVGARWNVVKAWELLANASRSILKNDPVAIQAFSDLIESSKMKSFFLKHPGLDNTLAKMQSNKINSNSTDFATVCADVKNMVENALPEVSKVDGLDVFLGSSGYTNASAFVRRHADLGTKTIQANSSFIKNADNVKFELKEIFEGSPNAVADLDFIVDGKRYIAEFKAGDDIISGNFSSHSINFMQRVDDLKRYKVFSRADVSVSKASVINDWANKGVLDNAKVKSLFENFKGGSTFLDKDEFILYLNSNNSWFNSIFNSNFL